MRENITRALEIGNKCRAEAAIRPRSPFGTAIPAAPPTRKLTNGRLCRKDQALCGFAGRVDAA